ncbi:jg5330 [Pararge aegeria aegeria]|uniref:Jg5330 protein n=1 Tax=Pararge aegeria aegeria TaxID=348720 RepID=A0A8S4R759_9NEOP|nr:jg5330 [Pararge aegeria aegeria]
MRIKEDKVDSFVPTVRMNSLRFADSQRQSHQCTHQKCHLWAYLNKDIFDFDFVFEQSYRRSRLLPVLLIDDDDDDDDDDEDDDDEDDNDYDDGDDDDNNYDDGDDHEDNDDYDEGDSDGDDNDDKEEKTLNLVYPLLNSLVVL